MRLADDIKNIKGIGEKTALLFAKASVFCVNDLLHYFPRNYMTIPEKILMKDVCENSLCIVEGIIQQDAVLFSKGAKKMLRFKVSDTTQELTVFYFGTPYLKKVFTRGKTIILMGTVKKNGNQMCLTNPKVLNDEEYEQTKGTLQPLYPLPEGMTNHKFRKNIALIMDCAEEIKEYLPKEVIEQEALISIPQAIRAMHFPKTMEDVYRGRRRLAFDEFFCFLLKLHTLRNANTLQKSNVILEYSQKTKEFQSRLPYALTKGQQAAWEEIQKDLFSGYQMNRLLQGDVGCGKTILAFLAASVMGENGYQTALMVPTEVLATQHFKDACNMADEYGLALRPLLLTGSMTAKEKKEARIKIEENEVNLIIGTHALIQDKVTYASLGLVITDEQHRFGVNQRMLLQDKGNLVHVLVMSATPIPRTLGLILYGDLDVSCIEELPSNRIPIKNAVVNTGYRPKIHQFIKEKTQEGRQTYIVCPMVEEGETEDVENVHDYAENLSLHMPKNMRIAVLHGKMKPKEKEKVMTLFKRGEIDVLVSTTVIEVGVNVPNATVMVIENAERFGLSQLHQLRGRVGRGSHQSYCMFVIGNETQKAKERLAIMAKTNNGFEIASADLEQRGPGDFFGLRQSGLPGFKIADVYTDANILKAAKKTLDEMYKVAPGKIDIINNRLYQKENASYIDFHVVCL